MPIIGNGWITVTRDGKVWIVSGSSAATRFSDMDREHCQLLRMQQFSSLTNSDSDVGRLACLQVIIMAKKCKPKKR